MWHILQLSADVQVEAEPTLELPKLLGSYYRANAELVGGEYVTHSTAICRSASRGRARPAHFPNCWVATRERIQSSWMANMWHILPLSADLKVEAEPGPHTSQTAG